jgi:hypothetical protein
MGRQYANITLFGIEQDSLLDYLTSLDCNSYVSPTENNYTVMYDISFQSAVGHIDDLIKATDSLWKYVPQMVAIDQRADYQAYIDSLHLSNLPSQQGIIDLHRLDSNSEDILKRYNNLPEGNLVCWSSHLSKKFSCTVLAVYLREESELWYHLSQNGKMLDEYTTYAANGWAPGDPIFSTIQGNISGGNSQKICTAFRKEDKTKEVEAILRKPYTFHLFDLTKTMTHEELLSLTEFPNGAIRHQALSKALDIPHTWVVEVSYEAIVAGELIELVVEDEAAIRSNRESGQRFKRAKPKRKEKANLVNSDWNESVTSYCNQIRATREIPDYDLNTLSSEIGRLIQALYSQEQLKQAEVLAALQAAILQDCPFTRAGKFSALEYVLVIAEVFSSPESHQFDRISQLAFVELSKLMDATFLSRGGTIWKSYKQVLLSLIEK